MHLRTKAVASATALFLIAGAGAAFADTAVADGDLVATNAQSTLALGLIPCNAATVGSVGVSANRNGGVNNNTWANSAVLTASGTATPPAGASVSVGAPSGTITLPSNWTTLANNTTRGPVTMPVTVAPTASTTSGQASLSLSLTGAGAQVSSLTRSGTLTVTWSTDCTPPPPANTAPKEPGTPVASANPTQGGFTLNWTPSTDAENDAFTYTLEGKRANDAAFSPVATDLTGASYSFGSGAPAEGTWTYRVKAVETKAGGLASGYSGESASVVVDRTAPNAPTASADRAAEYTAADGTSWWKDSVTVSFADNGDPTLPDTSAGSGVDAASIPSSQAYGTQGAFTASGTVRDRAGNESGAGTLAGSVDTIAPVLTATCPAGPFILGSSASMGWSATDDGGSGVAGAASGSVAIDTSTVGAHPAMTVPAVADNVGHSSGAFTCSQGYTVVYNFAGFFRPVVDGVNVAKAGSAIPLKFSLGGDYGLNIIQSTNVYLSFGTQDGTPVDTTVFAIGSGLQYDPATGQYTYVWKTDKSWSGKSGTMTLTLNDGVPHTIQVSFK